MAVEALCPTCGATFSLRDELQGKKVRCTKCEQVFTVGGDAKAKPAEAKQSVQPKPTAPAGKSAEKDDDEISTSKKNRPAAKRSRDDDDGEDEDRPRKSASRRGKDDDDDDEKPRAKASSRRDKDDDDDDDDDGKAKGKKKKRTYHDDDDDDEKPRKPARKSGGGVGLVLGIVGGGLFLVLLICGGISYWIYAGVNSVAEDIKQDMANNGNNGFPVAGDPGFVFDNNKFGKIDDALKGLKSGQATERQSAARWFGRQQSVDPGRQDEVAKALEPLLTEPDANSRFAAMNGLKLWATADNVPALAKALDDGKLDGVPADANKDAMAALGRLKDSRGAAPVARYMTNFFIREAAVDSLKQMGPVAEKAVLKYYFDKDGGVREKARVLVQGYGTKDNAIIAQAVDDVKQGGHRDVRRDAARWLKTARVDPAQQALAASTLANALNDTDNEVADAAVDALDTWATAESVPALLRLVEDPTNGGRQDNMRRKAIGVLGKLKATQAAPAVAARLPTGDRKTAGDALIAMGPGAKDEVMKYINHTNNDVRTEAKRVLASYGNTGNLDLTEKLGDLKGADKRKQGEAARWFQTAPVDESKRAEVSKALVAIVNDPADRGVQEQAIRAMGTWGTKDDLAALVKVVEGADGNGKNAAVEVLVKIKDERVVKPLSAQLLDPQKRGNAARNLIALGPDLGVAIENEVAAGLTAQDKGLKIECAKILAAVGTKASIASLTKAAQLAALAKQKDVADQCAIAVQAITLRGK
jgi:predicted Zn finger-like uncharacterized protein